MDDKTVVLDVSRATYRFFGEDYCTPATGEHEWTLLNVTTKLNKYGLHVINKEAAAVLKACIESMKDLKDADLEEAKDDEVMGPLATAELARRRAP